MEWLIQGGYMGLILLLVIGLLGGGIAFSVGTTETDKRYREMRKAQGYEL
jgi:hypothetical protein